MRKEWNIFLTALMFLTRLPVPRHINHSDELLQYAPKYFPLIGYIVAAISFSAFIFFEKIVGTDAGLLAAIIAGIFTTGAFHEDGFADTCDAFGGGWTKEKILSIMKDSRLGTYGVAGLVLMLSSKFLLLRQLVEIINYNTVIEGQFYIITSLIMIAAHSISRLMPVLVIQCYQYVTAEDGSKSKPLASKKLKVPAMLLAWMLAIMPLFLLSWHYFFMLLPCLILAWLMARYFRKWIGGYTGDCLGAVQQVTEIVCYLSFIILWKFIL